MSAHRAAALLLAAPLLAPAAAAHPGCGILVGPDGSVYVAGGPANGLFRVTPDGAVARVLSGADRERLVNPHHLVRGPDGATFTASDRDSVVWRLAPDGTLARAYPPPDEAGIGIVGAWGDPFALGSDGSLYAAHERRPSFAQLLRVSPEGRVTELAGGPARLADGPRGEGGFGGLHAGEILVRDDGSLLLTDAGTAVRRVAPDGTIETIAGGAERGHRDGAGADARFDLAMGLAVDEGGAILVADAGNRRIRRIAPDGTVSTIAGSGERGARDGEAGEATFSVPAGVAVGDAGAVYVLDWDERTWPARVRVLEDGRVRTLAVIEPE